MNVTEILNLFREYVDEPDDEQSDYPDSAAIQFINAEHRHLYSSMRETYEDWQGKEYIFPVSDGTRIYTLPRDIIKPRRIEILSSGVTLNTDTSVSPNYSYYTVDEEDAVFTEILPQSLSGTQSGQVIDYTQNRIRRVEGYTLFDQKIRFSTDVDLSGTQYCRVFYSPSSIDLHQAVVASATSTSLTLGTAGATTTIGPIRKIDNYYTGGYVEIISGSGVGEINKIERHDPTTRTIWIDGEWITTPTSSSVYSIVSPIVEDYQELLALGAAMRAKGIKTEDDISVLGTMYTTLHNDMIKSLDKRNEQTVRRVINKRGY